METKEHFVLDAPGNNLCAPTAEAAAFSFIAALQLKKKGYTEVKSDAVGQKLYMFTQSKKKKLRHFYQDMTLFASFLRSFISW